MVGKPDRGNGRIAGEDRGDPAIHFANVVTAKIAGDVQNPVCGFQGQVTDARHKIENPFQRRPRALTDRHGILAASGHQQLPRRPLRREFVQNVGHRVLFRS